jgi:hypothetical protein
MLPRSLRLVCTPCLLGFSDFSKAQAGVTATAASRVAILVESRFTKSFLPVVMNVLVRFRNIT